MKVGPPPLTTGRRRGSEGQKILSRGSRCFLSDSKAPGAAGEFFGERTLARGGRFLKQPGWVRLKVALCALDYVSRHSDSESQNVPRPSADSAP